MQIGMMGLGRMGANMVRRLLQGGHECVVYDINPASVAALVAEGATGSTSMEDFVAKLQKPACAWLMLPAAITGANVDKLAALMAAGDIIIDGGNSYYHDDVDKAEQLQAKGIDYVDVGTSGGVWGLERGCCLMIGGSEAAVRHLDPIFATLAPGNEDATGGRQGAGRRCGDKPAFDTSILPFRYRHGRRFGGLAAWQRYQFLASGPDGRRPGTGSGIVGV